MYITHYFQQQYHRRRQQDSSLIVLKQSIHLRYKNPICKNHDIKKLRYNICDNMETSVSNPSNLDLVAKLIFSIFNTKWNNMTQD